jgi:hypothetical protein
LNIAPKASNHRVARKRITGAGFASTAALDQAAGHRTDVDVDVDVDVPGDPCEILGKVAGSVRSSLHGNVALSDPAVGSIDELGFSRSSWLAVFVL